MNKVTMPDPVAYKSKDQPYLFSLSAPTGGGERWEGLTTTEQSEAYANARVKKALEEAADIADQHNAFPVYDAIRALIPKEQQT